jgi:hypothetical protein
MLTAKVTTDDGGVSLHISDGRGWYVAWFAIERIEAWKADLFTTDDVCVAFCTVDARFIVDEETEGWETLRREMSVRFPIPPGWFGAIVQPAFATNWTVLWDRRGNDDLESMPPP